ncbi:MarR family transcriptional regulator [Brevibacillus fluminis]|uniref:MarR family transcriptional regulator n=1 Tax=Brevibacillus fluminis TaxID=511487 RepID=A0A3M8D9Q1_9BACL|nr:MarR family transcriptional regulator [Brevibacillus fluminis]RNB84688.1 MarR family transcriptional regulator [Brevibacillus fluminis]
MSTNESGFFAPDLSPAHWELLQELRRNSARAVMFHQKISEKLGLNATDHKCLDFLNQEGSATAGRLAELTGLTTGAVTSVIDRLEQAGYVVRDKDPNDRRRVLVKPVEGGAQHISPLFQSVFQATVQLLSAYSEQEIHLILDFIKRSNELTLNEMAILEQQHDS